MIMNLVVKFTRRVVLNKLDLRITGNMLTVLSVICLSFGARISLADGPIRMGYFDIPPHVINSDSESPAGAAINYFNEYIAPYLGVDVVWDVEANPPTRLMDQLRTGEKDGMIFLGKTEERTEYFHYPNPYLTIPETLAFRKENSPGKIDDVTELHGLTIGFLVGGRIPQSMDVKEIKYEWKKKLSTYLEPLKTQR